ncbi:hypothetical protein [Flavobacterium eburneipallidum]|uniref:hypothetical protein n=1 Tax=Flavobacterium eburneipallidum TaxID=3003263 RepID=UPI0024826F16|nr:hypothetical protein [Flavobacterium eburneipallidum]
MSQIYLENWLKKTEIDYYKMFIFSWIPFNAWYMNNYYDYDNKITSDKDIIRKLKTEENPFRNKIINLLNGANEESISFKNNIYNLHQLLESNTIPNQEKRVSFSSLKTHDNTKIEEIIQYNSRTLRFDYLIQQPRTTKRFKCTFLKNDGSSDGFIELHSCSLEELEQHTDYIRQNTSIQKKIKNGFDEINPNKASSILGSKSNGFKIAKDLYFINNTTIISQFLVELLYQLRCKIFHGEIDPKPAYYDIYKYAYLLINPLIKTLN